MVNEFLTFSGKLYPLDFFTGHFKTYISGIFNENAIAAVGHIKRNVLIGKLRGGSTVCIPHINALTVFHIGCETFSQTVDIFADIKHEGIRHIAFSGIAVKSTLHPMITG